jgi:outer membrane receptor protein involved in Fe transport
MKYQALYRYLSVCLIGGGFSFPVFYFENAKAQSNVLSGGEIKVKPSDAIELEEVVVLAPRTKGSVSELVEIRRQTSAVSDVLAAEQIARAGDSDAAASLRRVTGLSLVNGKYVYVRGLGERYSSVQMNYFSLPSPEPSRRVVPLDLFPTSVLESVVVQKSYSPDLPGEFGGGLIQLRTRSLPEKFYFKGSAGYALQSSNSHLGSRGGSTDWFGMDDGARALPEDLRQALASGRQLSVRSPGSDVGIEEAELAKLGQSLSNNYQQFRLSEAPPPSVSLATGNRFSLGAVRLGVAGGFLYNQDLETGERDSIALNAVADKLVLDSWQRRLYTEQETRLAGSFDVGAEVPSGHRLTLSSHVLRHTTNATQFKETRPSQSPSTGETSLLEWTERQLWTKHLAVRHDLSRSVGWPIEIDWRIGDSEAKRDSPDRREYTYDRTADSYQQRGGADGNMRTYSELRDHSRETALDVTIPMKIEERDFLKVKLGFSQIERNRRSDVFRLYFVDTAAVPTAPLSAPIEDRLRIANRGPGKFMPANITQYADSYSGQHTLTAGYAMADIAPWVSWSFQIGVRHESSTQTVRTFRYFSPGVPESETLLTAKDLLPVYSLVWKPDENLRARLAYSETLARPDFRELSSVSFFDDELGYDVRGNPGLQGTVIRNVDHRWEYYFTTDEYLSAGVFLKQFERPIEVMFEPKNNNPVQTFANAKAANNFGVEFEHRTSLRHASRFFRRWSLLSNLTLIRSSIELDSVKSGSQTSSERPMQGQAPYVVNIQFQYDRPTWGITGALLYNVVGRRITEVGTNSVPDTYDEPMQQVDLVAAKTIAKNWSVQFRAKNLLDPLIESKQGDIVVRSHRKGRVAGVNLNATF